jgi:DNA-binding winged helix-turn-helix (wHTH) protein
MGDREKPVLVVNEGERAGQRWTVERESVIIGRGKECDIVLSEQQVSRQHIKIKLVGEAYYIEDLNSRNGTWLNGEQISGERLLKDGDEIHVAMVVKMIFAESEATAPLALAKVPASLGKLRLDKEARRVYIEGKELEPPLSLPQYRLLELLVDANGAVCTRSSVIESVWPEVVSDGVSERAIDALVRRLRDRIAELDPEHQYIITVRGHGFRLDNSM